MLLNDATLAALHEILSTLEGAVPGVRGTLVATPEGIPILCHAPQHRDSQELAALAATAFRLGERLTTSLGNATFTHFAMNGPQADLYLYSSGDHAVLAIMTSHAANVPLLHMEARDAAQAVALLV